jgi:hypothetical protein
VGPACRIHSPPPAPPLLASHRARRPNPRRPEPFRCPLSTGINVLARITPLLAYPPETGAHELHRAIMAPHRQSSTSTASMPLALPLSAIYKAPQGSCSSCTSPRFSPLAHSATCSRIRAVVLRSSAAGSISASASSSSMCSTSKLHRRVRYLPESLFFFLGPPSITRTLPELRRPPLRP